MKRQNNYFHRPLFLLSVILGQISFVQNAHANQFFNQPPRIQLAIILDTSNSMDGLIDQTRNQLWQVVNEFSSARQNGVKPVLEIALFEFGNDSNSAEQGYVRRLSEFTRELDAVSEGLFSLTTNGGSEYSGFAIKTALTDLQWSQADSDIKIIFIAGNESFMQGPFNYRTAIKMAMQRGVSVNTIHAGSHEEGINSGWQSAAILAGGDYMSIDANQKIVHVAAPQDAKIAELNAKLNQTYLAYGAQGETKLKRQLEQDEQSSGISAGLLAKRAASKTSDFYSNAKWDLVDALTQGEISEQALVQMEHDALPDSMKDLSDNEKKDFVREKASTREKLKQEIAEQSRLREAFVAEEKRIQAAAAPSISEALTKAIKKQAQDKNFSFVE